MNVPARVIDYSPAQLRLIQQTAARDATDPEFSFFLEACRRYGLDPFRRQISLLIFNKDKPDKRQAVVLVNRDGLRVLAQRCGNYRPASERPEIEIDPALIDPTNPKGLVRIAVRLWQQDRRSAEWHPVYGEAYWDEFAVISDEWEGPSGARRKTGRKVVEGGWARMPVVMLTKAAEAQALRAGWPETFGGLYLEEEMAAAQWTDTAAEIARREQERSNLERIGGANAVMMSFSPTGPLERVAMGQLVDRCLAYIRDNPPEEVERWAEVNRLGLAEFWARAAVKSDALKIKTEIEAKLGRPVQKPAEKRLEAKAVP